MIFRVFVCLIVVMAVSCKSTPKKEVSEADQKKFEQLIEEGKVLAKSSKFEDAISVFNKALKIDDTRVEANYGMGYALSKFCEKDSSRCKQSLEYYNKAMQIDDSYRNIYFNRSFTRFMLKDFDGALEDVNEAIAIKSDNPNFYTFRYSLFIAREDTARACDDIKKAMELGAKLPDGLLKKLCDK